MDNQIKNTIIFFNSSLPGNMTISSTTNLEWRRNLFDGFYEPFVLNANLDRLCGSVCQLVIVYPAIKTWPVSLPGRSNFEWYYLRYNWVNIWGSNLILVRGALPLKVSLLLFELSNLLFLGAIQSLPTQVSVQINFLDFQSSPNMQSFHPCFCEFKSDYITCFVREYY